MRTGPITQFCTSDRPRHAVVAKDFVRLLVPHLRERRIHHHDQSDRNRESTVVPTLKLVQERDDSGHQPAGNHSDRHCGKDPKQ